METRIGLQLGNYRLTRLLGQGAFADVYLGEHIHLGTHAALKVLQVRLVGEHLELFRNEARTIASLVHPNIIHVFDFGVEAGIPFLVMDYAPHGSLRQRYARGSIVPPQQIVTFTRQVAAALHYAHQRRFIHRDVKPENMLLGRNDEILLSDFGLVLEEQSTSSQITREAAGTLSYMAPEQLQGKPRAASDQYSLGIVVYEWLCGERPFLGNLMELMGQHALTPPPPLHLRVPTIPSEVEAVVLKALSKDPKERFADVESFAIALEQACQKALVHPFLSSDSLTDLRFLPASTPPHSPTGKVPVPTPTFSTTQEPTTLFSSQAGNGRAIDIPTRNETRVSKNRISRRVVIASVAGVVGASFVSGGILWATAIGHPKNPLSPVVIPTPTASDSTPTTRPTITTMPIGMLLYTYRGQSQAPYGIFSAVWSPDGTRIASSAGTVQIWDATNGGNVLTHHASENNYDNSQKIAWSPDGTRIVSIENLSMEVWSAKNGVFIAGHQSPLGWGDTLSWSPDNQRIVSGSDEQPGSAEIWSAASGHTLLTYRGHISPVRAVAWSPNGKWIVSSSMGKLVHVWDASNANQINIYSGHPVNGVSSVAWSPDSKRVASAGDDGTVHIWDASNGGHVYIYRGHFRASDQYHTVTSVAWSPDGTRIASGDWNHQVQIWDVSNGKQLYTYTKHSDYIESVAWSPDGKKIASASRDATVQIWQAS